MATATGGLGGRGGGGGGGSIPVLGPMLMAGGGPDLLKARPRPKGGWSTCLGLTMLNGTDYQMGQDLPRASFWLWAILKDECTVLLLIRPLHARGQLFRTEFGSSLGNSQREDPLPRQYSFFKININLQAISQMQIIVIYYRTVIGPSLLPLQA